MNEHYPSAEGTVAAPAIGLGSRETFIVHTYNHLFGAIMAFIGLEVLLFASGAAEQIALSMLSVNWLFILGAFVIVSWLASRFAHSAVSKGVQYLALTGFVLAEAIIFVPLLYVANVMAPGAIGSAAVLTILGFIGLTIIAFTTRKNFSFLGGLLRWGAVMALLAIVAGAMFGFQLGTFFSLAMVALAGGAILYDTSKLLHSFPEDRYVAAALELFASIALMFWYMVQLFIRE